MEGYFTNNKGKMIGKVSGDTYVKNVKKSKHLLRKWNAWGNDKQVLDDLACNGVTKVLIHETEEKIDYSTTVKDFIEKGSEADFGHSKQVFLPLKYFKQEKGN